MHEGAYAGTWSTSERFCPILTEVLLTSVPSVGESCCPISWCLCSLLPVLHGLLLHSMTPSHSRTRCLPACSFRVLRQLCPTRLNTVDICGATSTISSRLYALFRSRFYPAISENICTQLKVAPKYWFISQLVVGEKTTRVYEMGSSA